MKKGLQKQVFSLFLMITSTLIIIVFLTEWQIARFLIYQNENDSINKYVSSLKNNKQYMILSNQSALDSLISSPEIFNTANKSLNILKKRPIKYFYIYKRNRLIYGDSWDFLNQCINRFSFPPSSQITTFIGTNYNKSFIISYKLMDIRNSLIAVRAIPLVFELHTNAPEFQILQTSVKYTGSRFYIKNIPDKLIKPVNSAFEQQRDKPNTNKIHRVSPDLAFCLLIDYDISGNPSIITLVLYNRVVNNFLQQSFYLFILIILALTLLIIVYVANWLSKTIVQPIHAISQQMLRISSNPSILEPISGEFKFELQDMAQSFNLMTLSLSNFARSLIDYKLINENLNSGLFWLNENFEIILCNRRFSDIFEFEDHLPPLNVDLGSLIQLDAETLLSAKHKGVSLVNHKLTINDHLKYSIIHIQKVYDQDDLRYVGSITDTTEEVKDRMARQNLELELIKSNKLAEVGRRVEGVVHNINSPLSSILGYAQLLKNQYPDNQDLDKIITAGITLSRTVKTLLKKISQDNIALPAPVNLNELVSQELEMLKHNLFFKNNVKLEISLTSNLPSLQIVYGDLSQCVANILNNAVEAMLNSAIKVLSVKTFKDSNYIGFTITDTGEGIPFENLDLIFQPSFTTKTQSDKSGFGLGLAITKNIIERNHGTIEVLSNGSQGCTISVQLPL